MGKLIDIFSPLIPHSHCFLWAKDLVPIYAISNALIFICYTIIGGLLTYLYCARKDNAYKRGIFIYGLFIGFCGIGHLIMTINLWSGYYILETYWHSLTAAVSVVASVLTVKLAPTLISIPQVNHFDEFQHLAEGLDDWNSNLKALLNLTNEGWWVWNVKTGHDYLSDPWCKLLGYEQGDLKHHVDTWYELMHPDDRPKASEAMRIHLESKGKKAYKIEARYKHKLGHWVKLRDQGIVTKWDNEGKPLYMVGFEEKIV